MPATLLVMSEAQDHTHAKHTCDDRHHCTDDGSTFVAILIQGFGQYIAAQRFMGELR
eukprot:m.431712 g.431712  ORF g.431712 m.431712 type:complete len:57 (-) comp21406_c0_seq9:327-497(-)